MSNPLTTATAKSATTGTTLYDTKVRGLHLRVKGSRKSFFLYYRNKARVERRPKIGDFPTISVERAREIANEWLHLVAKGGDPVALWAEERGAPDVNSLADTYVTRHAARKKTCKEDERMLENYVRPRLGTLKVKDVTRNHIEAMHTAMKATPYQANRVLALTSKMFSLAEAWQLRDQNSNPCYKVPKFKEAKRRRYLKPDELSLIYKALRAKSLHNPEAVAFLLLLMFTGARPSEIASAKWSQLKGNRIELDVHKTDRNGAQRIIFLPPQAMEVLNALPRTSGPILGIKSPRGLWRIVTKETGLTNVRIYDFRHSFASAGVLANMTLAQIGELLGHKSAQTTLRYAHLHEEKGVAQATLAADYLDSMVRGTASAEAGNADHPGTSSNPRPIRSEQEA